MTQVELIQMQQIAKQAAESLNIIQKTDNPETFFSRWKFCRERVYQLEALEKQYGYKFPKCEAATIKSIVEGKFFILIKNCYNEYTDQAYMNLKSDKAIRNRIKKFWDIAGNYINNPQEIQIAVEKALSMPHTPV